MTVNQSRPLPGGSPESRLYLREDELDRAVDLIFAASRRFWKVAENALAKHDLGQAHYRALAAIRRTKGMSVSELQARLGVRKQSLARVLDELESKGLIARAAGSNDRRQRLLAMTEAGRAAEREASAALYEHLAKVFRGAGQDAVAGARLVLEALAAEGER